MMDANTRVLFGWHAHYIQIVDVTDKKNPIDISAVHPTAAVGSHSGWISKDKNWLFSFDEGDEIQLGLPTLIRSISIKNFKRADTIASWIGKTHAIEHNGYVVGDKLYISSYTAGMKVFDVSDPTKLKLTGSFDTIRTMTILFSAVRGVSIRFFAAEIF